MIKTIQVILFSKSAIPNNDKLIEKFIDAIELNRYSKKDLAQHIDQGNGQKILVSRGGLGGLDIEMSTPNEDVILSIFGINVQLTFKDEKINDILDKMEKTFKILDSAYLDINRIGFISTSFDEKKEDISHVLNMPYLSKKNEIDFRINEQIMIENLECNNNIFISNRKDEKGIVEKGLFFVQDLNTRINLDRIFAFEDFKKIFDCFKNEYYGKNISEILK